MIWPEGPRGANGVTAQEKDPRLQEMVVYRVRHGESVYHEHTQGKNSLAKEDLDLTEKGIEDIHRAAATIAERIDPKRDAVVIVHSPRRRALDASNIIEKDLVEKFGRGVIYRLPPGQEHHIEQPRVRSFYMVDESNDIIPTDDPRYPEFFNRRIPGLTEVSAKEGVSTGGYIVLHGYEGFEDFDSVLKRTRNQLTFFRRIAKQIQPKIAEKYGRRLVIVETEHNETLDDLAEHASKGEYTLKKGTGINPGEVVEMVIPSQGNEMKIGFPQRGGTEPTTLTYNSTTRKFE